MSTRTFRNSLLVVLTLSLPAAAAAQLTPVSIPNVSFPLQLPAVCERQGVRAYLDAYPPVFYFISATCTGSGGLGSQLITWNNNSGFGTTHLDATLSSSSTFADVHGIYSAFQQDGELQIYNSQSGTYTTHNDAADDAQVSINNQLISWVENNEVQWRDMSSSSSGSVQTARSWMSHPTVDSDWIIYRHADNYPSLFGSGVEAYNKATGGTYPIDVGDADDFDFVPHAAAQRIVYTRDYHQEIAFSDWNGQSWTTPSLLSDVSSTWPQCEMYFQPRVGGDEGQYVIWGGDNCDGHHSALYLTHVGVGNTYLVATNIGFGANGKDWFSVPYDIYNNLIVYEGSSAVFAYLFDENAF